MRIFHNKLRNEVIIVTDNLACSFYSCTNIHPASMASEILNSPNGLADYSSACKEIKLPAAPKTKTGIKINQLTGPNQEITNKPKSGYNQ